jgi:hypothetical protein
MALDYSVGDLKPGRENGVQLPSAGPHRRRLAISPHPGWNKQLAQHRVALGRLMAGQGMGAISATTPSWRWR